LTNTEICFYLSFGENSHKFKETNPQISAEVTEKDLKEPEFEILVHLYDGIHLPLPTYIPSLYNYEYKKSATNCDFRMKAPNDATILV